MIQTGSRCDLARAKPLESLFGKRLISGADNRTALFRSLWHIAVL
jgi:hypothetical protein